MEHIPVHKIDVSNLSSENYSQLMDGIRELYVERADDEYMDVPITTQKEGWCIISLDLPGSPSTQLLVNLKNGYLTAIRDGGEQWYYFAKIESPPGYFHAEMIKHLKADYHSLVNNKWEEVAVGPMSIVQAYHVIVNFDNELVMNDPKVDVQRKALARLAVMFCEGARLRTVRRLVSHQMDTFSNAIIDPLTSKKITSWSLMSKFALHCWMRKKEKKEGYLKRELAKLAACGILTMEQAIGNPDGELLILGGSE